MTQTDFSERFEAIIDVFLQKLGFKTSRDVDLQLLDSTAKIDFVAIGPQKLYVETKFYRSEQVYSSAIDRALITLIQKVSDLNDGLAVLAVSSIITSEERQKLKEQFGVVIWDRGLLLSSMLKLSITLKESFEQLLMEAQQGTEIFREFTADAGDVLLTIAENVVSTYPDVPNPSETKADSFKKQLAGTRCGRDTWNRFELLMSDILKYLFNEDLTLWDRQTRTDDMLSRFDLVCRIKGYDSYWQALMVAFNTRFILFEFKNYCGEVTQYQVYTTERYLYQRALRSVGFIISRKGADDGAIQAAKGALKENGKLIMFLTDHDIITMLDLKENGGVPNDYLSDLLDQWLVSLSR